MTSMETAMAKNTDKRLLSVRIRACINGDVNACIDVITARGGNAGNHNIYAICRGRTTNKKTQEDCNWRAIKGQLT